MVRRRTVLATVGAAATGALAGCTSGCSPAVTPSTDPPPDDRPAVWPQPGGRATKTGRAPPGAAPGDGPDATTWELWEYTDDDERRGLATAPVVADGRAYVATGRPSGWIDDPSGRLFALDPDRSDPVWSAPLPDGSGGAPALADDAVLVTTRAGDVAAFDRASGDERWRVDVGPPLGTPTVAGGHCYVGDDTGRLTAVDLAAGAQCRRYSPLATGAAVLGSDRGSLTAPAIEGATAYVALDAREADDWDERGVRIAALDLESGDVSWYYDAVADGPVRSPAVADGVVYAATGNALHAIDAADGTRRWRFATGFDETSRPAVADGTVYVSAKNVYALDAATGAERWRLVNRAYGTGFSAQKPRQDAPVAADDRVFVGLGALDAATGDPLWGEFGSRTESAYFGSLEREGNLAPAGPAVADGAMVATVRMGRVVWFS
mgnify:CR=1 FL=1